MRRQAGSPPKTLEKRWITGAEAVRRAFLLGTAMTACGLDFGTSNTTFGSMAGDQPSLLVLESGHTTIPSAIFFARDGAVLIGRRAIEAYVDGDPGRLMRSLKSVLGTSLIDETTQVGRE